MSTPNTNVTEETENRITEFANCASGRRVQEMVTAPNTAAIIGAVACNDWECLIEDPTVVTFLACFAHAVTLGAFLQSRGLVDFDKLGKEEQ